MVGSHTVIQTCSFHVTPLCTVTSTRLPSGMLLAPCGKAEQAHSHAPEKTSWPAQQRLQAMSC